ncbi:hypothetical protein HDU83_004774 [Entophlyctis luteolus]|nr:hypothetical protein HDU83_004774 [Entophlyctis luteolus]KAJ3382925.1 hypothetical protein HDU84_003958 [Entophlyctis sp. JEL0112]
MFKTATSSSSPTSSSSFGAQVAASLRLHALSSNSGGPTNTPSKFSDRTSAGAYLAARVLSEKTLASTLPPVVLALPRGGVPVAFPVARALKAPLDVLLVRKLGIPGHDEVAMGAISVGGIRYLNHSLITDIGVSSKEVDIVVSRESAELQRRNLVYRNGKPPLDVADRVVYLVDDGIATGATMCAAVHALRQMKPLQIIAVAPVGAPDSCQQLANIVDKLIVPLQPPRFNAVGLW